MFGNPPTREKNSQKESDGENDRDTEKRDGQTW